MSRFYNDTIEQRFLNPQHAGQLSHANLSLQVGHPGQSDVLQVSVHIDAGKITQAKFKAHGKLTTVAAGEYICEQLPHKTLDQLPTLTAVHISDALGLPQIRQSSAILAAQAVQQIKQQWSAL